MEELGAQERIEALQVNQNDKIYKRSQLIIKDFFSEPDEQLYGAPAAAADGSAYVMPQMSLPQGGFQLE